MQSTRTCVAARTFAPTHPQERGAVRPARVLVAAGNLRPAAGHFLILQDQPLGGGEDPTLGQDRLPSFRIEHRPATACLEGENSSTSAPRTGQVGLKAASNG